MNDQRTTKTKFHITTSGGGGETSHFPNKNGVSSPLMSYSPNLDDSECTMNQHHTTKSRFLNSSSGDGDTIINFPSIDGVSSPPTGNIDRDANSTGLIVFGALRENLQRCRETRGLSRSQLAEAASIPEGTIRGIETGARTNPHLLTLVGLARALGVTMGQLCGVEPMGLGQDPNSDQDAPGDPWDEIS